MAARGADISNKLNVQGKNRPRFGPDGVLSKQGTVSGPPMKRAKKNDYLQELIAPTPTLCGLPTDALLHIMTYLSVLSLFHLSLVSRRFFQLGQDSSVWENVELTQDSIGKRLDSLKMKKLIRIHLPSSLCRVVLEETHLKGNLTVTEAVLDLLFKRCPKVESITLLNCDLTKFGADCPLFKSCVLKSMTMRGCFLTMDWMECLGPTWPQLESLSLQDSAKTNDRDLQYMMKHDRWKKTLRHVDLRGCYRLSFNAIATLCGRMTGLKVLDVRGRKHNKEELEQRTRRDGFHLLSTPDDAADLKHHSI